VRTFLVLCYNVVVMCCYFVNNYDDDDAFLCLLDCAIRWLSQTDYGVDKLPGSSNYR